MKISVIIPAHNEEKYLGKTLENLREQNYLNYETIIICNGCNDKTEEVAKKYLNQNTKIFSLDQANVSLARNHGAQHAQGELLVFLDADTLLSPNGLRKISEDFTPECSVAATKSQPDNPKFKFKLALGMKNLLTQTGLYKSCGGALICRKKDFHQVGEYPKIVVKEQQKLILKLIELGKYKLVNTKVTTSTRRYEQWGLTGSSYFWAKQWFKNKFSNLEEADYEIVR